MHRDKADNGWTGIFMMMSWHGKVLTHWGRDNMAANFLVKFSNAFSLIKINKFSIKISLKFVPRVQLTIFKHWFRYWLGADQATSHYLKQWWLVNWRIYASIGLNELNIFGTLCEGNPSSLVDSPHKGPVMYSFDPFQFVLITNTLLNKQLSCWSFRMPWCSCEFTVMFWINF